MYFVSQISDDELPIQFKCSKTSQNSTLYYQHKFMLLDEDTDDDIHNNTATTEDNEDGIWVNINDLEEPWYPLKEYNPRILYLMTLSLKNPQQVVS